ncbi:MAG: class D beta-lactamase, partial [Chloroflexota bacterium]
MQVSDHFSEERDDFGQFFAEAGVEGAFILYDLNTETYLIYNRERANVAFIPASTFKIFNSLVALETGQVKDDQEIMPWDGVTRNVPGWDQDQNLQSAIRHSAVWYYQELARRIGAEQMAHYVMLADYGNQDIRGEIDTFWLKGALRITSREQVDFLRALYQNELPFSQRSMDIVKDILIFEEGDDYILRAKTGWGQRFTPQVGWFVGYLEQND